jgi:DnaD/phage-associated family protein
LIKEDNLMVFQPKLAKFLGLNKTIILNQIHYWLEKKKNIIDERSWVYNTYEAWQEQICFLSVSTIKKCIKKLEAMGIVIASNFNRSKIDKTKWYTIDYELLQKLYENNKYEEQECSSNKVNEIRHNVNLPKDINDQSTGTNNLLEELKMSEEEANLDQAIPKITSKTTAEDSNKDNNRVQGKKSSFPAAEDEEEVNSFKKIVCFYSENIRLPGAYELEKIKYFQEEFKDTELIIFAMKQSIAKNARNLRYMESVLYNWLDNGIKTLEEAEAFIENYRKNKGGRENGRFAGINEKNKYNNSKDSSKDSAKWKGYKSPKPKRTGDINIDELI